MDDTLGELLAEVKSSTDQAPAFDFHLGEVVAFDSASGSNIIRIRGALVPDVPLLNIGDTVNLTDGNVVVVLKYRTGYFILGRVVQPNSEVFATSAVQFEAHGESANTFPITTTMTVRVSETFTVPAWANRALAFGTVSAAGINSLGALDQLRTRCDVAGLNGAVNQCDTDPTYLAFVTASRSLVISVTPGSTFDIEGLVQTNDGTWASSAFNQIDLSAWAVYTKV